MRCSQTSYKSKSLRAYRIKVTSGRPDTDKDMDTTCSTIDIVVLAHLQVPIFWSNCRRLEDTNAVYVINFTLIASLPLSAECDLCIAGRDVQCPIQAVLDGPRDTGTWCEVQRLPDHVEGEIARAIDDGFGNAEVEAIISQPAEVIGRLP